MKPDAVVIDDMLTAPDMKPPKDDDLVELVKQLPQTIWVIGTTHPNDVWMAEGVFDTEQEAIDNCKKGEFIALLPFGKRLPDNVRDVLCIYWPHEETRIEGSVKLEELRKVPVGSLPPVKDELPVPKMEPPKEEPVTPRGYGEIKVGMEGNLNGVPVVVRKITKKDIIMRPLNRAIRDEHGMMVSFKEKRGGGLV